jgi:uncharacterized membrane protein
MSHTTGWWIVLLSGVGCYGLKFAGYALPQRWFNHPLLRQALELMPVALLAALIVVESIANGRRYDLAPARLAGVFAGGVAIWRRAPFIVVVALAAATAGLLRKFG